MYITAKDKNEYEYLVERRKRFIGEMSFFSEKFDRIKPDGTYILDLGIKRIDRIADAMYRDRKRYRRKNGML